jgi:hypothetical protein
MIIRKIGGRRDVAIGDPLWADVNLLILSQAPDAVVTFVDYAGGHTVTPVGDAKIVAAQTFGGRGVSSGYIDGTGDALTIPDSADFSIGSGPYSGEMFVRFTTLPSSGNYNVLFGQAPYVDGNRGWLLYVENNAGTMRLGFGYTTAGSGLTEVNGDFAFATGVDYFVAFTIDGSSNVLLYAGAASGSTAAQVGSTTALSGAIFNSTASLDVGRRSGTTDQEANFHFIGPRLTAAARSTGPSIAIPARLFPTTDV